jgi:hypothetical protein
MAGKDFHPDMMKLFDQYVPGGLNRRCFLQSAARFTRRYGRRGNSAVDHHCTGHIMSCIGATSA